LISAGESNISLEILKSLKKFLEKRNIGEIYTFTGQENVDEIINNILETNLLILDINLGKISGIDILKLIREKNKSLPVVLITAYTTAENIIEATKYGVRDILEKPFEMIELLNIIEKVKKDFGKYL